MAYQTTNFQTFVLPHNPGWTSAVSASGAPAPAAPPSAMPGTLTVNIDWNAVENLGVIAQGSFGYVFKARYARTLVCVKKLQYVPTDTNIGEFLRMFNHELNFIREIRHPNIVQYLYHSASPPNMCIMMELLPGSVRTFLNQPQILLSQAQVLRVAAGVARGMAFLHSLSPPILHRNLCSDNVLVTRDFEPKIAGFGLSKVRDFSSKLTGREMQRPEYLPPETIQSNLFLPQSDVYMYGMFLWELLTRRIPFPAYQGSLQIARAIVNYERPLIPDDVPAPFREILLACWVADPNARPGFDQILVFLAKSFPQFVEA